MNIEVRHLLLVQAVAESGSLTAAGERLHLTQSALSHQLLDLEERLGTKLFHRLNKRMRLTPAGERILASASRVLQELEHAEEEVKLLATEKRGLLRITVECYTGYHWLPDVLQRFRKKHPGVEVRIDANATSRALEAVIDGSIDLAIMSSAADDRRVKPTPIFEDEFVAVMAPAHRLADREFVTAADLQDETILTYVPYEESTIGRVVFAPAGVTPRDAMQVPLTEAMIELARAGIGIAATPRWSIGPYVDSDAIAAVRITRRGLMRHWKAVVLRDVEMPAYVGTFIDLLENMPAKRRDVKRYVA